MSHKILLAWLLVLLFLVSPASSPSPVQARPSAVFTVNDTTDATDANPGDGICETAPGNGVCSLRAAIQETNALPGMDIVILPSGIYMLTIAGANEDNAATGDLDIKDDLLLVGMGADQTIVDGNGLDRVFDIFAPANVTLGGLTVRGGYESSYNAGGGGIRNTAQLNINNSTVFSNTDGYFGGGGIYNRATVVMDNVIISNNITKLADFYRYGVGGGIYNSNGSVVIDHSLIVSNTGDYSGGGIYNLNGALTIKNSSILSNSVSNTDGGEGGIYNYSESNHIATAMLISVTVSGNSARFIAGVLSNGVMTATNSHFDNNIGPGPEGFAAGLANGNEGSMTLDDVTVNGNLSIYDPGLVNGGILTITNSTVANNIATSDEAGFLTGGMAVADHVVVSGNSARQLVGALNIGILTMTNSLVTNNYAQKSVSGFYSANNNGCNQIWSAINGAPRFLMANRLAGPSYSTAGILSLDSVTITNNASGGSNAGFANGGTALLNSVMIQNNTANNYAGAFNCGDLAINNSSILSNTAQYDGGGLSNSTNAAQYAKPSNATLTNVTLSGNQALNGYGGGILSTLYPGNPYSSSTSLLNVTLSNNTALTGSNIAILTSTIWATNTIIANGISGTNCYFSSGMLTSLGHNLEDGNSCGLNAVGDLTNTNPLLGPLQDNGGNTLTHALLFGSPAIDAGDNNGCPRTDQRGWLRPFGRACDIGAFELHYPFWFPIIFFNTP